MWKKRVYYLDALLFYLEFLYNPRMKKRRTRFAVDRRLFFYKQITKEIPMLIVVIIIPI